MSRTVRMSVHFATAALGLWLAAMDAASAQDSVKKYQIGEQSLGQALREFALASNLDLLFSPDLVAGKKSSSLDGKFTVDEGLRTLLRGSDLEFSVSGSRVVINEAKPVTSRQSTSSAPQGTNGYTRLAQAETRSPQSSVSSSVSAENSQATDKERIELEEILVTGSQIRGAQPTSQVIRITREEMRLAGQNNLGEAFRALPQNFSGGQNPGVMSGATGGGLSNQNVTGGSSLNLRGLGPDASLTLLNGARLPYDGFFQATDVAVIPIAAIDRMEILLDGASAIYGSDAVGGVANIILRRDYSGAELSVRHGTATDGGFDQEQYTGMAGHVWSSGGLLVTADYSHSTQVRAIDRNYLAYLPRREVMIHPPSLQKGALISGHQTFSRFAELSVDAFYSERQRSNFTQTSATALLASRSANEIWGVTPAVRFALSGDWSLRVHGAMGQNESASLGLGTTININTGAITPQGSRTCFCNKVEASGVDAEGPLFEMPGGEVRFSVGAGYRKNEFEQIDFRTQVTTTAGSLRSRYGYGEINVPLLPRFSLNAALRHERYDTFGNETTPKVGVIWSVKPGLDLKASWGRSFKVPTLNQQYQSTLVILQSGTAFGVPGPVMQVAGGNRALRPEEADVRTAGFVLNPQSLPGFTLEVGGFDIDYTGRIVEPLRPLSAALANPEGFPDFVTLAPSAAQQSAVIAMAPGGLLNFSGSAYDSATVYAIADARMANAAMDRVRGMDLSASYATAALGGKVSISASAGWVDSQRRNTRLSPELTTSGVAFFPAEFKGRLGASWSRHGLTLASYLNYIDGVTDIAVTPNVEGNSMTTVDMVIDYQIVAPVLGDVGLNLSVTNLLNDAPPFLRPARAFEVNYDSTNYSALGRTLNATLTKRF